MAESHIFQLLEEIFFSDVDNRRSNRIRYLRKRQTIIKLLNDQTLNVLNMLPERRLWSKVRSTEWWDLIIQSDFNYPDFKEDFRVSRSPFIFLCNELRPLLQKRSLRSYIPVEKRIAITLMRLGSCGEMRLTANQMGVAKSTVCSIVQEVCKAICEKFKITFPSGNALQRVAEGFLEKDTLIGCCGVIDGSHIPIKAPVENAKDFYCRKQFHSIVLQAVIDSNICFMNVNIGWPGSVHDARIFRNSNLFTAGETGRLFFPQTVVIENERVRPFIMGDSGYPALTWLKRPYVGVLNNFMIVYNRRLCRGRASVEHSFGQLKGRWRCLLKENESDLENVKLQVYTCCILHNLCKIENDAYLEQWGIIRDRFTSDDSD